MVLLAILLILIQCTFSRITYSHKRMIKRSASFCGQRMAGLMRRGMAQALLCRKLSHRPLSCCAGPGTGPPQEVIVEYEERVDNTEHFIKLANEIEDAYPEFVVSGNPDSIQPRQGSFEVASCGYTLFSKLKAKRLPKVDEVLHAIQSLPKSCNVSEN